ncbi:DUF6461 domain-containing protein [Streptomyces sp. NPDC006326]|uniref:DUF6461 domain-containing protein n=1 Tax=Streptomyces sp. NPDC006326 TaxID=3156752 RepID=UPI0033A5C9AD
MGAEPCGTAEGTAGLIEADEAHRAEVGYDYWDESYVAGAFKAPGENGDWTVVLGFDCGLGVPCVETLSQGGRVVAHSSNGGKPIDLFHWFEDGELRTTFESPSARDGNSPDELVPLLREAGFPLTPGGEQDESAPSPNRSSRTPRMTWDLSSKSLPRSGPAWSSTSLMPTESVCPRNGPARRSRRLPTAHGRGRTRRS